MYSNTENLRDLMKEKEDKAKLFNNVIVVCYCGKDVKVINYKKYFYQNFIVNVKIILHISKGFSSDT
jgi:hypothetical protein